MINEHQTTILVGETGSGKTTQIAQFITEAGKPMGTMAGAPLGPAEDWLAASDPVQRPCASGSSFANTRPPLPSPLISHASVPNPTQL